MAKLINASSKSPIAAFKGGTISAVVLWRKDKATYTIRTPLLQNADRTTLADFADAIRLIAKHIGKMINKPVSLSGTKTDPDEPEQIEGRDITVVYEIFPKDKRYKLSFTHFWETGKVRSNLQAFTFTDLPSVIQVAFICIQTANLMREYEDIN